MSAKGGAGTTPYTHLSLFSGIGGLDLAAEWAGFTTIGQVEKDDYCLAVLEKHWPGVPKWKNVEDVTADALRDAGIKHRPVVLSGGFPCQPFSCAGKQEGTGDDHYLWPEMYRVVQELRPAWVVGENVAGIVNLALDDVCDDLERAGYTCRAFLFPAASVGAPHKRDRVFIVAHAAEGPSRSPDPTSCSLGEDEGSRDDALRSGLRQSTEDSVATLANDDSNGCIRANLSARSRRSTQTPPHSCRSRKAVPNSLCPGREERNAPPLSDTTRYVARRGDAGGCLWQSEPRVGRVADGVSFELDIIGGLLNEKVNDSEARSARDRSVWQILRNMWEWRELAETSPELYIRKMQDSLPELSYKDPRGRWLLGKRITKDQDLCDLWQSFYSEPFDKAQDLQRELLERTRKKKRPKGMGSNTNRLRALGNAVVPQQAYPIFRAIMEVGT